MAGHVLAPNEITVMIKHAGKNGASLRYRRYLAGLTVRELIARLESHDKEMGGLPDHVHMTSLYYLNREVIVGPYTSEIVVKQGDVFWADSMTE